MNADLSRVTFDPTHHRTDVVSQQGRVMLDADWNEQRSIDEHLRTRALVDIIGPAGAPIDADAFGITAAGATLTLSAGRYYLGGHLLECDKATELTAQVDLPDTGPFVRRTDGTWVADGDAIPQGTYVAWLTSWSQHRSAVEEPEIREVALGGPDTTTRLRTLWQVRLLGAGDLAADVSCADEPPGWDTLTNPSTGTLAVYADPEGEPTADCLIPEASPYRGLDNQLYRIQIHQPGGPGSATYVWSADNGAVTASWVGSDVDVLTVKNPGRDGSTGFAPGCWVELTDDRHEQLGIPGTLVRVDRVDGDSLVVLPATATGSIDHDDFAGRPRARRWDGTGTVPADGSEVAFELGVRGTFGSGASMTYRTGDYWTAPARTATADVEWPRDVATPRPLTPHGPERRHARLAVLAFDGTAWSVRADCRPVFASLVGQLTLSYIGGDGQEAVPDIADPTALVAVDAPLVAGVATGGRPVADARVRFRVVTGDGTVDGANESIVTTGASGTAAAAWLLDSQHREQTVTAELLDPDGQPRGLSLVFTGTLSTAAKVAYDPTASPTLNGTTTVQEAIDRLATTGGGGGCQTLVLGPDSGWREALETLGEASGRPDATVCLRPGRYETDRMVTVSGMGSLRITGAGGGTEIVARGVECALSIEDCDSVVVRDLTARVEIYPDAAVAQRRGVITVAGCREVDIADLDLRCPDAVRPRGACLTIRAGDGDPAAGGDAIAVTERATVRDCRMVVGHAQTGALVVNARSSEVSGCRFSSPVVRTFGFEDLLLDRVALNRMVASLVEASVADRAPEAVTGGRNTSIDLGDWQVRFDSAVPQREWRRLVAAEPPTSEETATAADVRTYMDRITLAAASSGPPPPPDDTTASTAPTTGPSRVVVRRDEIDSATLGRISHIEAAVGHRLLDTAAGAARRRMDAAGTTVPSAGTEPVIALGRGEHLETLSAASLAVRLGALPTFDRQLEAIRASLGDEASAVLDGPEGADARKALLVAGDFDVVARATLRQRDRDVVLAADIGVVRFDSPLPQGRWEVALAEMPPADRSAGALSRHLRAIGRRMLIDPAFSARVAPGLLDGLRARNRSTAASAVRVGGRVADVVTVTSNLIRGAAEGIHVGLSDARQRGGPMLSAGSVRISGNDISLTVPIDRQKAPRAVFVGNVDRASVRDNRTEVDNGRCRDGVVVDGALGLHVVVRENELADSDTGVRLRDRISGRRTGVLWDVSDNIAPGSKPPVVAPSAARVSGNVS